MRQILYFTFSVIFLFCLSESFAQKDSLINRGFRVGFDMSKIVLPFFFPETKGYELLADLQVSDKIFIAGEYGIGRAKLTTDSYNFNYNLSGTYVKLGIDKNVLKKNEGAENDIFFVGARYSFSSFKHKANNINIEDDHWDDLTGAETDEFFQKAHWIDVVVGIKTELLKNFYLGWTIRGMIKIRMKENNIMTPYIIPGFGKGSNKAAFGFNYSIYYKIPVKLPVKEKSKKEKT